MKQSTDKQYFTQNIASIAVVHDHHIAPYVDTFAITPQNIIEREHGSLIGFFRIYDESNDSAYIANFLTSVLKKAFYASTQRDTESALEMALAKINIALGELAQHNSAQWIGKVDGAICAFTQTTVCFSSCGNASIKLFRNNTLIEISATQDTTPDVLSTFNDIACGPLKDKDLFIIASRECDDILSHNECQRACIRYSGKQREQFFRTALINQSDGSCMHLVEITPARVEIARRSATFDVNEENVTIPENVFSATTFSEELPQPNTQRKKGTPSTEQTTTTPGHIYLQGDETDTAQTPFIDILKEHTFQLRATLRRWTQSSRTNIANTYVAARTQSVRHTRKAIDYVRTASRTSFFAALTTARRNAQKIRTRIAQAKTRLMHMRNNTHATATDATVTPKQKVHHTHAQQIDIPPTRRHTDSAREIIRQQQSDTKESFTSHSQTTQATAPEKVNDTQQKDLSVIDQFFATNTTPPQATAPEKISIIAIITNNLGKITNNIGAIIRTLSSRLHDALKNPLAKKFLPHPHRIVTTLHGLTLRQRINAFILLIIIVTVPLIIERITRKDTPITKTPAQPTTQTTPTENIVTDRTSTPITRTHVIHKDASTITIIKLRGELYAITPRTITQITNAANKRSFTLPKRYSDIVEAVAMDDLNLLFFRTSTNEIISFTPLGAKKFVQNKITFPAGLTINAMASYRTYLYFFDSSAHDVYRYPRVTGGFGAAVDWLNDDTTFTTPHSVTIDGTIYIINADGAIQSFFKHKKKPFPKITLQPALTADYLFTSSEKAPLFILDRTAQRIVAVNKENGAVIKNITHKDFATAKAFTVNERLNIISALLSDGTIATYKY